MSFVNESTNEKWLKDNGYTIKGGLRSVEYGRIGNSKYLWDAKYLIKDFDKHFVVKNNPFCNNSNKKIKKSVCFFFGTVGDELTLYYYITGNNCITEFKEFQIEKCARILGQSNWYKREYLDKAKEQLVNFLINFLDSNCIGIDKEIVSGEINSLNKEKKSIDLKIARLENAIFNTKY